MTPAATLTNLLRLAANRSAIGRLARLVEIEDRAGAAEGRLAEQRAAFERLKAATRDQLARLAEAAGRWRETAAREEGQDGEAWLVNAEREWEGIGLPADAPHRLELIEFLSTQLH